jgi:uncharacterized phage protein gp47/JayE
MAGITSAGFSAKSLEVLRQEVNEVLLGGISDQLDLGETSPWGQLVGVICSQLRQLWEVEQENYANQDPYQATGAALESHTRKVGVNRRGATPSQVLQTVTLAAGTYTVGTLVMHVVGDPTARFANRDEITTVGGTLVDQVFESEATGAVRANAGTLTVIASPVVGFTSGTNPLDADLGSEAETDAALRLRWQQELARRGSSTVDAIRADVLQVSDFVRVYENDGDSVDANGLPGHSFEVLVLGGDDDDIAQAIFDTKAAGIQAYGSTVVVVTDDQGNGHNIGFSRPDDVDMYFAIQVNYLSGQFIGADAFAQALADWGDANLGPGNDVIVARITQVLMDLPGVVDVAFEMDDAPTGAFVATTTNFPIGVREIARLDTSRIVVNALPVLGVP